MANTALVRYFLAFEPKLRALLHTVRLWMKQKDLLGRGHRFNTYTLFWMIVCALQLEDNQLPSVQSLAARASKSDRIDSILHRVFCSAQQRQYGPWNCSIPDIKQMEKQLSNVSIGSIIIIAFDHR